MSVAPTPVIHSKPLDVALREIPTFSDLTDAQMAWLVSHLIEDTYEASTTRDPAGAIQPSI